MSLDKNSSASVIEDQSGAQVESLESSEIEAVDLETISGGLTIRPAAPTDSMM